MEEKNDSMISGASLALVGYSKDKSPRTLAYRYLQLNDNYSDVLASLCELRESFKDSYDKILIHLQTIHTRIVG